MHFLADENFPLDAVEVLRQNGYDVAWIRYDFPGISDPQVLERAQAETRIVLTFDKDFGELAFREKLLATAGIILFRNSAPSGLVVAEKVSRAIAMRDDWNGHFSVVDDDKVRMRVLAKPDVE
jgi:predicted nuclease of predicted toxin-antitoxin system